MYLEKYENKLDDDYIDTLYARIKSNNKLLRQETELNEHVKKAFDMENTIRNSKDSNRFQVLSTIFLEVIRIDPYYGRVLNEIKKEYDSLKENTVDAHKVKILEKELLSLKSQNLGLTNENKTLKKENEELKDNLSKNELLKKEEVKKVAMENVKYKESKDYSSTVNKPNIKGVPLIKQLSPQLLDTDVDKYLMEKPEKSVKMEVRTKSVKVPRLDLSKIKNKYAEEKVVITQEVNYFVKKNSEATLTENKSLLNEQTTGTGKFKNWKDLNSHYIDLCNKTSNQPKSLLDKFKRGIY